MSVGILLALVVAVCVLVLLSRSGDERVSMSSPGGAVGEADLIQSHLRAGRKIAASKLYREEHDVGLKEAKEAVERLAQALPTA